MAPALVVLLAILLLVAMFNPMGAIQAPEEAYQSGAFVKGFLEGYNTMDALASLVFAIIIITVIRSMGVTDNKKIFTKACGLKGHRIGGAQISPRHANFIENADGARSDDAVALMAEARRRAREQFGVELQHEVEFLGPLELPPLGRSGVRGGESRLVRERKPQRARARAAVIPLPGSIERGPILRVLPSGRSILIGFAIVAGAAGLYLLARSTPMFALNGVEVAGAPPPWPPTCAPLSHRLKERAC